MLSKHIPWPPDPANNQDWIRWNSLGIALLGQFQYTEAIAPFTEVIKLRYDYADGHMNIGLPEIRWEKHVSARTAIRKALTLIPNSARALYYNGLLQRRAGNTEQEIANFHRVLEMLP